jgi:transcriptional regulator with XRE-family HTH domain
MKTIQSNAQGIGERIKEARTNKKMSQATLAEKLGFESAVAISLIESGKRNIDIENLQKTSEVLEKDIKYFLGEEDKPVKIEVALRSQTDLGEEDKDAILRFIELAKKKHAGGKQ